MATDFKMPQLGETVVEGTVTRWLKKEGDSVQADEPLVEVSTDKVDSEIPAPASGTLIKIHVQEGDTVQVGSVIAEIGEAGESGGDGAAAGQPAGESKAPEEAEAPDQTKTPEQPVEDQPKKAETTKDEEEAVAKVTEQQEGTKEPEETPQQPKETPQQPKEPSARDTEAPKQREPAKVTAGDQEPRRGILSPLVRKLAAEHNLDLDTIQGTGTGGRITKQDVMAAVASGGKAPAASAGGAAAQKAPAEAQPAAQAPPRVGAGGEEIVAVSNMRKLIAEHMVASVHETARAWNAVEVDMTAIGRLRKEAGPAFKEKEGYSLTWMPFICKSVSQALQKYPQVNSTWNGDGTITRKHYVNLGIAVALENGLIVPVIKGADGMNIVGLSRAVRDVAVRARGKKLVPDDVHGGTFTITNPGPFGSILSVPIINKGQAGILAVDAVVKRPVVVTDDQGNDSIAVRQMLFVSMSWDHRVIDGAEAAQFLATIRDLLQEADFESDLSGYLPG